MADQRDSGSGWRTLDVISLVLVIIGALNWGLVGVFAFNLVAAIFGEMAVWSRIIYILVGVAGIYAIFALPSLPSRWSHPVRTEIPEHEHAQV